MSKMTRARWIQKDACSREVRKLEDWKHGTWLEKFALFALLNYPYLFTLLSSTTTLFQQLSTTLVYIQWTERIHSYFENKHHERLLYRSDTILALTADMVSCYHV